MRPENWTWVSSWLTAGALVRLLPSTCSASKEMPRQIHGCRVYVNRNRMLTLELRNRTLMPSWSNREAAWATCVADERRGQQSDGLLL